jgi:hypothetical protein
MGLRYKFCSRFTTRMDEIFTLAKRRTATLRIKRVKQKMIEAFISF